MRRVIVLVGPKGAGKSTIGDLLEHRLGIRFVRTEPLFLAVHDALGGSHPDYERRGFEAVSEALKKELATADTICCESTGASRYTQWLLDTLGESATVLPIRVVADNAQCVDRIHHRDATIHIPVSDDRIAQINAVAMKVQLPWVAEIDNQGLFEPDAIVQLVQTVLTENHE